MKKAVFATMVSALVLLVLAVPAMAQTYTSITAMETAINNGTAKKYTDILRFGTYGGKNLEWIYMGPNQDTSKTDAGNRPYFVMTKASFQAMNYSTQLGSSYFYPSSPLYTWLNGTFKQNYLGNNSKIYQVTLPSKLDYDQRLKSISEEGSYSISWWTRSDSGNAWFNNQFYVVNTSGGYVAMHNWDNFECHYNDIHGVRPAFFLKYDNITKPIIKFNGSTNTGDVTVVGGVAVTIDCGITDYLSTTKYQWTTTATKPTANWTTFTPPITTPQSVSATWYLHVSATDLYGRETYVKKKYSIITADITPPTGSISINNGSSSTTTPSVTLNISATDNIGVAQMEIRNDNDSFTGNWETYSTTKPWTLSSSGGTKYVYIRFRDSYGNVSPSYHDTIIYTPPDTTAPTGSISINNGSASTASTSVTLNISATDNIGVAQMEIRNDNSSFTGNWETYSTTKPWTLSTSEGTKYVYIRFRDSAGNVSSTYYDTISYDKTLPAINSTDPSTGATGVDIAKTIAVTFSENIVQGSTFSSITFKKGSTNVPVTKSINGKVLTIDPSTDLAGNTTYTLTIPASAVKDASGNALASQYTLSFKTLITDTIAPTISSTDPFTGAAGVDIAKTITVTFSENIVQGSTFSGITFKNGSTDIPVTISISGKVLTIDPSTNLVEGTTYTLTIPASAVKDASENALASQYILSFQTLITNQIPPESIKPFEDIIGGTIETGDVVSIGTYNGTDLTWHYLGNGHFTMTREAFIALNHKMMFKSGGGNQWVSSDIKTWLNGDFYTNAFTTDHKSKILYVSLPTLGYYEDLINLSKEYLNYSDRWWLSSFYPGNATDAYCIDTNGTITHIAAASQALVRPMLKLKVTEKSSSYIPTYSVIQGKDFSFTVPGNELASEGETLVGTLSMGTNNYNVLEIKGLTGSVTVSNHPIEKAGGFTSTGFKLIDIDGKQIYINVIEAPNKNNIPKAVLK